MSLKYIAKFFRKILTVVIAPSCPFNLMRIAIYRVCGFKIGKGTFIGMRCYLDDVAYDKIIIGENVTISYGVYFAAHGHNQGHNKIIIKDKCYVGMRASIISPNEDGVTLGSHSVIGASALVNKSVPDYATAVGVPCRIL